MLSKRKLPNHNQLTGARGETLAIKWLISRGYLLKERNWRHGRLEIDIITLKKNTLHFVEVKTVTSGANGFAEEKINKKKIKHMLLAARHYLRLSNWGGTVQLDVLAIHINADVPEYHLFEDIWP